MAEDEPDFTADSEAALSSCCVEAAAAAEERGDNFG
jgi:hypothetical protein